MVHRSVSKTSSKRFVDLYKTFKGDTYLTDVEKVSYKYIMGMNNSIEKFVKQICKNLKKCKRYHIKNPKHLYDSLGVSALDSVIEE